MLTTRYGGWSGGAGLRLKAELRGSGYARRRACSSESNRTTVEVVLQPSVFPGSGIEGGGLLVRLNAKSGRSRSFANLHTAARPLPHHPNCCCIIPGYYAAQHPLQKSPKTKGGAHSTPPKASMINAAYEPAVNSSFSEPFSLQTVTSTSEVSTSEYVNEMLRLCCLAPRRTRNRSGYVLSRVPSLSTMRRRPRFARTRTA